MATLYIQLQDKLLQISGELTAENISKALGYVPVDSSTMNNYATKDEVSDLVDMSMVEELSQRVDNITFDSLKDNPFLQDGSGELNIVDEAGNIIAKIDADGIHSVDFIAGEHRLSDKTDKTYVDEAIKNVEVDLTGYATEEYVNNIDFYNIKDNPIANGEENSLTLVDENGNIGLKVSEDGLYVKDIIADGHTLSQKADKSELPSLDGYATESYVNTNLQNYATKDEVSDLVDMSVVTELQGKVETLVGEDADKSVRDIAVDVLTETLVSETATEAYDTLAEMSAWIKSHPEDAAAMNTAIQKNATDITNLDAAYKAADAKVLTDAQEYTDNINFYTIKDNPIVDNNDGNLTFVDESGNIGLQFSNNAILVNDVITPEHTLSSKADKSFVEDNYYNKSTVDKKITDAVTGGQVSLDGFATEQWVNEQGFIKEHQDISHLAEKSELPTKTSDLTNDSGFITINDVPEVTVPTKVSELENDSKFITIDDVPEVTVPTKTSELTNDSGFITINDVPVLEIPEEYVTETELNDKGFLTEHQDISHLASRNWVESQGYAHQEDLLEISFNDIQDSPISIDDSGMINFVDESGNVGFQINEEGLRVTDVIAGEHKLSEKANASDIPSLDGYAKTEDIPSVDGFVKSEDLPNFDEFAKTNDIPSLDGYAKTEDIPSLDDYASKEWVNNKNYATEYELKTIDYSSINNVPVSEDETGELNIADESGNIGMKVASEAVYAKDFVAGEHKLSEKVDKTYVDNSIAELVDGAPETLDTLNELAAALNDNADIVDVLNQSISNKQDTITDLETIRQGAAKGATALQSYTEQYKGTVTGVKINGTTKNPSSGIVDLGTVITAHQDISGKQDNLVSGTNIKTINGESILGDGDLSIQSANIVTLDIGSLPTQNSSVAVNFTEDQLQILRLEDTVIKITFNHLGKPHVCTMFHTINGVTHMYSGVAYIVKNSVSYDTNKRYVYGQFGYASNTTNTITFTIGDIILTESDVKTINGQSLIGSGDITISGGSSDANVAAVDTGDVLDDVTVDYATKTYVDGLVGDINSILESIINGGITMISFKVIDYYINNTELVFQAEEGMTWEEWINSEYNTENYTVLDDSSVICGYKFGQPIYIISKINNNNEDIYPHDKIMANHTYVTVG